MAILNKLFGVIPGTAGVRHEDRKQNAGDERAGEKASERFRTKQDSNQQRGDNGHDAGNDHFVQGGSGGNTDTGSIIGFACAFENSRDFTELAADFFDHFIGSLGNRVHGHGRESKGKHSADQKSDHDVGGKYVNALFFQTDFLCVRDEECESGQRCGTDCKTFAHGSGGVADGIELIRNLTNMVVKAAHLSNTAGVIRDRAIGVDGNSCAGGGKHANGCEGNAVQAVGNLIGNEDADTDENDGNPGTHHTDGYTADNRSSRASLGLIRNTLDRTVVTRGVDLGHVSYDKADNNTGNDGKRIEDTAEELQAQRNGRKGNQRRGDIGTHLQSCVRVGVVLAADEESRYNGCRNTDCGDEQWIESAGFIKLAADQNAKGQRRDDGTDITLKKVSAHTGDVADVVTDVVSNNRGIARVIFRNTSFYFADQVRSNVSSFGINTAADTGKERDGRGAEREAEKNVIVARYNINEAASQQAETDNAHTHDGAAGKSN